MIAHDAFPVEPWSIRETELDLDRLAMTESIFALANGHLGMRGNLDEGEPRALSGTYLGGFYESHPIAYGERGYGFAEDGQTVVNVTDGKVIRLLVEDEPLDMHRGRLESHERELDLRSGVLTRRLTWTSQAGRSVRVTTRRLVSFRQRSVAAISYEVEALGDPLRIALQSNLLANQDSLGEDSGTRQATERGSATGVDPRQSANLGAVLESRLHTHNGVRAVLAHTTRRSGLSVAAGMEHILDLGESPAVLNQTEPDLARLTISARLEPGRPLSICKLLAYHWSGQQSIEFLRDQVDASLENALAEGWEGLVTAQRKYLDAYWEHADIVFDGDPEVQQGLRFALFQVLQASARAETRAIPAKGLTGPGYDGHAFWDTESFVLPVLTYSAPKIARDALIWRHSTLAPARERAQQLGLRGAALPWRTINGAECSGYWPAGTAAFHINADVADAVCRYVGNTDDVEFEREYGVELLVETARLWESLGHFGLDGHFRIDGVTGPDEYSALADNNVYTNLMAQSNLRAAADAVERHPQTAAHLGVGAGEPEAWMAAAEAMRIPFDEQLGVHPQDEHFTTHQRWDFDSTPPENYPLLLHYPYFQLYRRQVVKQADLVLALFARGEAFDEDQLHRDFDYYEALTVRDSSLSACVQATVAARVGHIDLAYDYIGEAALIDLHDLEHNVGDGLHIASLAGAVIAVLGGLGGVRQQDETLSFHPRLPPGIERLAFSVLFRSRRLRVEVTQADAVYRLAPDDEPVELRHWSQPFTLSAAREERRAVPPAPRLRRPAQPPGREPARRYARGMAR